MLAQEAPHLVELPLLSSLARGPSSGGASLHTETGQKAKQEDQQDS